MADTMSNYCHSRSSGDLQDFIRILAIGRERIYPVAELAHRHKLMTTPAITILLFLAAPLLAALGQYLCKSGADLAGGPIISHLLNARLFGSVVCYIAVIVLFVAAFKKGGSLIVLYPIYTTTFIWAAVPAMLVYGAAIKPMIVTSTGLPVVGMYLMGK
jgi:hypothetical protein